jgi:acetyltransferase
MGRHRLSALFDPASVALYGATERPGSIARRLLEGLRAGGYSGAIGAVNPRHRSVLGQACVASGGALDFVPDLALAAVPAASLPEIVTDCARRGTRFIVDYTGGFDLASPGGRAAQRDCLSLARERGVRIVGPHCTALMRPASRFEAGFTPGRLKAGGIGLMSQSGAVVTALLDWANAAGLGFSSVLSLGQALDLDLPELLDWYLFDAQTESVLLFLESIRDARGFMSSVRALARVKPVIIMKAGRGLDLPNTVPATLSASFAPDLSSLIDADQVFGAAIARAGAVRADTTMQLLSAARLLAPRRPPTGPRVAIVANGGGPGTIAADALARSALQPAQLQPDTLAAIDATRPGGRRLIGADTLPANPLNLLADADAAQIEAALRATLADEGVDAVVMLFMPQTATPSTDAAGAIIAAAAGQAKPVAAVLAGGASIAPGQRLLDAAGIPTFITPENAVDALALLERFARNQRSLRQVPVAIDTGFAPDVAAAQAICRQAIGRGQRVLDAQQAGSVLAAFGIDIGFRIGVGLPDADGAPQDAPIREATAARTVDQREAFLGMTRDAVFGAVIAFGAGGVARAQIDDIAVELPPLDAPLARALIGRTRLVRRLRAYRDIASIDFERLEQTLVRFSTLVCACPMITRLDLNPLQVDARQTLALGAHIEVGATIETGTAPWRGPYGHLAIHPYPRELEALIALRDGRSVLLRAIRPEDAELERVFIAQLSPETLYRRFMMPVKALPDSLIERFTQIDYDRELALVAMETGSAQTRIVGVARITPTWDDGVAEFAIVVGDWLQRSGLGREMMQRLIDAARSRGYRMLEGRVLGTNAPMLQFCKRLGFSIVFDPQDMAERIVRRSLLSAG